MKWNEEAGLAHLLSTGIQQYSQLAVKAVSCHAIMHML